MTVEQSVVDELVRLSDGSSWERADRLLELFPAKNWGSAEDDVNTGLHAQLDDYEDELRRNHGIEWKSKRMLKQRNTAVKWPRDSREPRASFDVHLRIRGDNRYADMKKYLKRADEEGVALSRTNLGRYRADEKGVKPLAPIDERWVKKIDSHTKRFLIGNRKIERDDWWRSEDVSKESLAIVRELGIQYFEGLT